MRPDETVDYPELHLPGGLSPKEYKKERSLLRKMTDISEIVSAVASLVIETSKVSGPISVAFGILSLVLYAATEGVSVPPPDASFISFLSIYVLLAFLYLTFSGLIAAFPAVAKEEFVSNAFKELVSGIYKPLGGIRFRLFLWDYLVTYFPLYFSLLVIFKLIPDNFLWMNISCLIIISYFMIFLAKVIFYIGKSQKDGRHSKIKVGEIVFLSIWGVLIVNFSSLSLVFPVYLLTKLMIADAGDVGVFTSIIPPILFIIMHGFFNARSYTRSEQLIWIVLLGLIIGFTSGLVRPMAAALNFAGNGGRIPVTVHSKNYGDIDGCMILNAGSTVSLRKFSSINECNLQKIDFGSHKFWHQFTDSILIPKEEIKIISPIDPARFPLEPHPASRP